MGLASRKRIDYVRNRGSGHGGGKVSVNGATMTVRCIPKRTTPGVLTANGNIVTSGVVRETGRDGIPACGSSGLTSALSELGVNSVVPARLCRIITRVLIFIGSLSGLGTGVSRE